MSGITLGRKAELISPIPTKKSSTSTRNIRYMRIYRRVPWNLNIHGMTLTRFGDHSQTSALSSIITTIDVSHGKSRCKLFCVKPVVGNEYTVTRAPHRCQTHFHSRHATGSSHRRKLLLGRWPHTPLRRMLWCPSCKRAFHIYWICDRGTLAIPAYDPTS